MTNVLVPESADGRFPSCIFTQLPLMKEEWKSKKVPVTTLLKMSQRENELRVHDAFYSQLFFLKHRDAPGDYDAFMKAFTPRYKDTTGVDPEVDEALKEEPLFSSASVIILLQYQVLVEFGYSPLKDVLVLYELRTAAMMHSDVSEFQQSVQFKYNKQGNPHCVVEGEVGPDVPLYHPATLTEQSLHSLLIDLTRDERATHHAKGMHFAHYPTVVLSGSYT